MEECLGCTFFLDIQTTSLLSLFPYPVRKVRSKFITLACCVCVCVWGGVLFLHSLNLTS